MSNKSVFSGIKNPNPFNLKLPNINSEEFDKVINTRRSVRVFSDDLNHDFIVWPGTRTFDYLVNCTHGGVWRSRGFTAG